MARGFWQGSKQTQWVTLPFPVSLPFYSRFTVFFSRPVFLHCPCLPARITSANRKQMSSSDSEVAVLCPSHHQGKTFDIHFYIPFLKMIYKILCCSTAQVDFPERNAALTRLLLPEGGTFLFRFQLDHQTRAETDALFDSVPASERLLAAAWKANCKTHTERALFGGVCGANTWTCPQKKPRVALPTAIPQKRDSKLNQVRTCQRGEVKSGNI